MTFSFKRITSSGNFIPEIDGLRFIAIAAVVLFHLNVFLSAKAPAIYTNHNFYFLKQVLAKGYLGVALFFVISGFILGMPFAKFYLADGKAVSLKKYYFRRLTRLEPPYILVMTVLLFATVFVAKKLTLTAGIESYFASVFYMHNFIYGKHVLPLLDLVAWSLEIEVQFYLLAPLMARLFGLRPALLRRMLIGGIAVFFLALNYFIDLPFLSLINYIQYFFIGFLLADLYVSKQLILPKTRLDPQIALILVLCIWFFSEEQIVPDFQNFLSHLIQLTSIFGFYYYVMQHKVFKFLSFRMVTNIGGMCYSIYLLHIPILSMVSNPLMKHSFSGNAYVNIAIYSITLIASVLIVSSIYFLLVERPCMHSNWVKKLFKRQPKTTIKLSAETTLDGDRSST